MELEILQGMEESLFVDSHFGIYGLPLVMQLYYP